MQHPEAMPGSFSRLSADGATEPGPDLVRAVADHVAGMTDRYAQRMYIDLFVPRCWADQ
jgi:dGTPase